MAFKAKQAKQAKPKIEPTFNSSNLNPVSVNMILSQFTFSIFGFGFPRELIIFIMETYHNLFRTKVLLGKGNFETALAGTHKCALYVVDTHTNSWIALPMGSNGYIIHSPDGKKCTAWCGAKNDNYDINVTPILEPNGDEIFSVNDKRWKSIKKEFKIWTTWTEKDGILTFTNGKSTVYQVEVNMNINSDNNTNWKYFTSPRVDFIPHDGKLQNNGNIGIHYL